TNLQAQGRQSIEGFAIIGGVLAEGLKDFPRGTEEFFAAPFPGCLPLKGEKSLGNRGRALDRVSPALRPGGGHGYFFLRFRDSWRWIFSISASTSSMGTIGSISVYFCKSAAVNSARACA